ncbi:MAG: hypothetical protein WDA75_12435 [Candidatus Latescibacterota bacterium]|jgi:hypothetical protein
MTPTDDKLRQMIRLIPPARALRDELEKALGLETYEGVAAAAIRTYRGLQAAVAANSDDPYVATLALETPGGTTDRQKVAEVNLLAAQLVAFLEGQTGLVGFGQGSGDNTVQYGPHIIMQHVDGVHASTIDRMLETAGAERTGKSEQESQKAE